MMFRRASVLTAGMLSLAGCSAWPVLGAALEAPRGPIKVGEVLVGFVAPPDDAAREAVRAAVGGEVLDAVGLLARLRVAAGQEMAACRTLRSWPGVAHAEPNRVVRSHQVGPIRPASRRMLMRALNDDAFRLPPIGPQAPAWTWGLTAIRAESAWDVTPGSASVTVAIIDTGVDTLHPDLQANMNLSASKNFVEPGQKPDDDFGHGTHVAGIVAAVGDNTLGASGVAFGCKIAAIRVLGVDGTGTTWSTVQAIDWAVEKGCKVLNMSLGSPDASPLEAEAIARATAAGSLVVAAAGNEAADGNYLEYPACYPGVLSVAAVDRDEKRATFSNYNSWVGVAAPGVDIFSTIPTKMSPTSPYGFLSGTSMASPMAAGAAALLYSQNPRLTPAQVVDRLKRSAKDLTPPGDTLAGYDVFFGAGLIQADKALGR
jgi:subtilisin family serine protease